MPIWVQPVVVIRADFEQGVNVDGSVAFVVGHELHRWLTERPVALPLPAIERLSESAMHVFQAPG
jgi:hypothetical protein